LGLLDLFLLLERRKRRRLFILALTGIPIPGRLSSTGYLPSDLFVVVRPTLGLLRRRLRGGGSLPLL